MDHSIEAEQGLLGAVLVNNQAFEFASEFVSAEQFFEPIHRAIFEICGQLIRAQKVADPITIRPFFPVDVDLGAMKIKEYLARLAAEATTIVNARDYAKTIRDFAHMREIRDICGGLMSGDEPDPLRLATEAIERLDTIVASSTSTGTPSLGMREAVARAVDAAAIAYQNGGKPRGLSYGIRAMDQKTLGAAPGHLIVIAGRPGMGKTAFALDVAENIARDGQPVMFYSAEMGDVDLTLRMVSNSLWRPRHRLTYWQIASGKYREQEFTRIRDAGLELSELPLRIEQEPGLTISQIASRARQMKRRRGLKALFVDHLGLVKPSARYAGNKVNETGEVTMGLKGLAKELEIPIFLLCQINRGVEGREDKRPSLADLRNSGDIEQDADTVLILFRQAYYHLKKEPLAGSAEYIIWADEMARIENRLEVLVEKQRAGPVGSVRLFCDIACNVVRDEISEMDDSLMLPGEKAGDFV